MYLSVGPFNGFPVILMRSKWEKTFLGPCGHLSERTLVICLEAERLSGGSVATGRCLPDRSVLAVNPGGMKQVAVEVSFM